MTMIVMNSHDAVVSISGDGPERFFRPCPQCRLLVEHVSEFRKGLDAFRPVTNHVARCKR